MSWERHLKLAVSTNALTGANSPGFGHHYRRHGPEAAQRVQHRELQEANNPFLTYMRGSEADLLGLLEALK